MILAVIVLLGAFVGAFYHDQGNRSAQDTNRAAEEIRRLLQAEQEQKTAVMTLQLQSIMNDPRLTEALRVQDRDTLQKLSQPIYNALVREQKITHFYYHRPDRVNLLRLHHPEEFGDSIKRFTAVEAERTGKISSGIERGPLGTFVLRVVAPWRQGDQLLGYIELGMEFEDLVKALHGLLDTDFVIAVDKTFLDREQWNKAIAKSPKKVSWDQFPNAVVMDKTMDTIPAPVAAQLKGSNFTNAGVNRVESWNGHVTQLVFLPLKDASGKVLGQLIVLKDVTPQTQAAAHSVQFVLLVGTVVSAVLLSLFYVFLGRMECAMAGHTKNLKFEIAEREHTQEQLRKAREELERRVEERTRELQSANQELKSEISRREQTQVELDKTHKQLLEASRLAGMSEVATGVLHNVGNVLNSVNVSASLITDNLKKSRLSSLGKAVALLNEQSANLGDFFTNNPKGAQLVGFLSQLNEQLNKEQRLVSDETEALRKNIEHIKDIVSMQQSYAKMAGVSETLNATDLMEDALRMNEGALERHGVEFIRDYPQNTPDICVDRHKVLQILVNLIRNAKYACDESAKSDKKMILQLRVETDRVKLSVIDNGVGIPPENMARIFNHGFTTRKEGHGFGLHSGALAAKEMGGRLTVESEGRGKGATFTLELPLITAPALTA